MTISAILTVVRGPSAPYTTPAECKNCTAELLADMNEVLIRYLLHTVDQPLLQPHC